MQDLKRIIAAIIALASATFCLLANTGDDTTLWKIQRSLARKKYVDLTHAFEPGIPRWPGFPDETRKTIYWYAKRPDTRGSGFFSEVFTHVGEWGTHVDTMRCLSSYLRATTSLNEQPESQLVFRALRWAADEKQTFADGSVLHRELIYVLG